MKLLKVVKLTKNEAMNVVIAYKVEKILSNGNFGEKERAISQLLYSNVDQISQWDNEKLLGWLDEHKSKVALDVGSFDCFEIISEK